MTVGLVGLVCIFRQMLTVSEDGAMQGQQLDPTPAQALPAVRAATATVQPITAATATEPTTTATSPITTVAASSDADVDLEALLTNLVADFRLAEETLQCSSYAGPMFLPNNPGGKIKKTNPIRAARLPDALDRQPKLRPTRWPLAPFSLHAVRLLPGSRFAAAEATNLAFLRLLDPDRLLYFFRERAGIAQPSRAAGQWAGVPNTERAPRPYGGWESAGHVLRGEFVGHYLMAASTAAAATGDAELKARVEYVVGVLEQVQAADGYLSAFPQTEFAQTEQLLSRHPAVPYYVMHKLLAGLLAHHELWNSAAALGVAVRLALHLLGRVQAMLRGPEGLDGWRIFVNQEVGGMSEALTDLARATGSDQWLQLAALFERPCFLRPLVFAGMGAQGEAAAGEEEEARHGAATAALTGMHANTHLPQILGAMARYGANPNPNPNPNPTPTPNPNPYPYPNHG